MFMHGSWLHLIGNMLFLWIFGRAVEDAMPRLAYLLFYLACGFAADVDAVGGRHRLDVPNIGASGAIAGVLGGYLVLYPRDRVLTALPLVPLFLTSPRSPPFSCCLTYFALQLLSGSAQRSSRRTQSYGIAYFAHIGGFVAGLLLARPMATRWRRRRRARSAAASPRPSGRGADGTRRPSTSVRVGRAAARAATPACRRARPPPGRRRTAGPRGRSVTR